MSDDIEQICLDSQVEWTETLNKKFASALDGEKIIGTKNQVIDFFVERIKFCHEEKSKYTGFYNKDMSQKKIIMVSLIDKTILSLYEDAKEANIVDSVGERLHGQYSKIVTNFNENLNNDYNKMISKNVSIDSIFEILAHKYKINTTDEVSLEDALFTNFKNEILETHVCKNDNNLKCVLPQKMKHFCKNDNNLECVLPQKMKHFCKNCKGTKNLSQYYEDGGLLCEDCANNEPIQNLDDIILNIPLKK
jgi:hypothetical protein